MKITDPHRVTYLDELRRDGRAGEQRVECGKSGGMATAVRCHREKTQADPMP